MLRLFRSSLVVVVVTAGFLFLPRTGRINAFEITNFWEQIAIPSFTDLPCYEDGVETSSGPVVFHDNYPLTTNTFRSLQEQQQTPSSSSEDNLIGQNTSIVNDHSDNDGKESSSSLTDKLGCLAGMKNLCRSTDDTSSTSLPRPVQLTTVPTTSLINGKTVRKRYTVWKEWSMVQEQIQRYFTAARSWLLNERNWILDHRFGTDRMEELFGTISNHLHSTNEANFGYDSYAPVPFVQRVVVPEGSRIAVFGDLHGAYHSFLRELYSLVQKGYMDENFCVQPAYRDSFYILFLGDYVDRGYYGLEVLLTILHLKRHNPLNVFISRGNHEDRSLNEGASFGDFSFEILSKFDNISDHQISTLYYIYDTLPSAIFLGVKPRTSGRANEDNVVPRNLSYLLCCHGGIEVGYETLPLLSSPVTMNNDDDNDNNEVSSHFSLIHGFFRQDWLRQVPPDIDEEIPKKYRNLFSNVGQRPTVQYLHEVDGGGEDGTTITKEKKKDDDENSILKEADDNALHEDNEYLATTLKDENELVTDTEFPSSDSSSFVSYSPPTVTNMGWDYHSWPRTPTGTHPHNGFMWNDFFVYDDNKRHGKSRTSIYFRPGRGIAYGKTLTEYYLQSMGLVGILRAHQHNNARETGPMLDIIKDGTAWNRDTYHPHTANVFQPLRGMADIWDGAGRVLTFLSGSYVPGFDYGYDSYGLLVVPSTDPREWTIDNCVQKVGNPYLIDIHKDIYDGNEDRKNHPTTNLSTEFLFHRYQYLTNTVPSLEHEKLLTVNHACNIDNNFICTPTPWRIRGFTENEAENSMDRKGRGGGEL